LSSDALSFANSALSFQDSALSFAEQAVPDPSAAPLTSQSLRNRVGVLALRSPCKAAAPGRQPSAPVPFSPFPNLGWAVGGSTRPASDQRCCGRWPEAHAARPERLPSQRLPGASTHPPPAALHRRRSLGRRPAGARHASHGSRAGAGSRPSSLGLSSMKIESARLQPAPPNPRVFRVSRPADARPAPHSSRAGAGRQMVAPATH
jgi:hypothetical protein